MSINTMLKIGGLLVLLGLFIAFPQVFSGPDITTIAVFTLLFATAATGWNIFSGYTGYIALGHAVYFGLGGYALTLMCQAWHIPGGYLPFWYVPLAGLIAAAFAVPFGWIALRTRRHTFIVITIATFFVMQLMAYNLREITGGSSGLNLPIPVDWSGAFYNLPFYYAALILLVVTTTASWWIRNSKYGLGLLAIRDDEDRAKGLGVRVGPLKLSAFVTSAFFVGMVGAVYFYFIESIYPPFAFDALFDVELALMAFLGGLGTISGPIIGALILKSAQQELALTFTQDGLYLILYGVMFLVIIRFLPLGIVPTLRKYWQKWRPEGRSERTDTTQTREGEKMAVKGGKASG